jgi:hypothetical protein
MTFRYQSFISFIAYENIEPLAQLKLKYSANYEDSPIMANYENKVEYFYARQIYSDNENFDMEEYILSLPIVNIENSNECNNIIQICLNRKIGQLENYLRNQAFMQEVFSVLPTSTTTSTTTVTSTTVTTTPCPTGVPSRIYYINATNVCAICVATNEFVCSPYENYNYVNCLNSANSINQGNTDCTTTTTTSTTTTTLAPTSTTPIGPQG